METLLFIIRNFNFYHIFCSQIIFPLFFYFFFMYPHYRNMLLLSQPVKIIDVPLYRLNPNFIIFSIIFVLFGFLSASKDVYLNKNCTFGYTLNMAPVIYIYTFHLNVPQTTNSIASSSITRFRLTLVYSDLQMPRRTCVLTALVYESVSHK